MTKGKFKTEKITEMSTNERILRAFGPLGGGLLLDFADLTTFGTIGFYLGSLVGGLLGWWLATVYRFGLVGQCVIIVLAAAYCTLPGTGMLPIATVIFALIKFSEKRKLGD
ncbi:MAG: hypothetical protein ACSHWU_03790 [Marinicella sp.]